MKKYIGLALLMAVGAAHADWSPRVTSTTYTASIQYGGGVLAYNESGSVNGPLKSMANQIRNVPYMMESAINTTLSQKVAASGASFLGGTLSGDMSISLQPDASGAVFLNMSGLSYQARSQYSGKKWGIISYSCVNTLTLSNLSVTAQYGAANGQIQSDKIGLQATPSSSTDCDSNLSWILPFVGDYIINRVTATLDRGIVDGITSSVATIKDQLFYGRDQNFLVGLNKLIPGDKVVSLPGGGSFPIGQYVQNNLAYLLSNSQMTLKLGKGAVVAPVYGTGEPFYNVIAGDVLSLSLSSPAISFGVKLSETSNVTWNWKCSIRDPSRVCPIP